MKQSPEVPSIPIENLIAPALDRPIPTFSMADLLRLGEAVDNVDRELASAGIESGSVAPTSLERPARVFIVDSHPDLDVETTRPALLCLPNARRKLAFAARILRGDRPAFAVSVDADDPV